MKDNPDLYSDYYNEDEQITNLEETIQDLTKLIEELKNENKRLNDMLDAYRYGD